MFRPASWASGMPPPLSLAPHTCLPACGHACQYFLPAGSTTQQGGHPPSTTSTSIATLPLPPSIFRAASARRRISPSPTHLEPLKPLHGGNVHRVALQLEIGVDAQKGLGGRVRSYLPTRLGLPGGSGARDRGGGPRGAAASVLFHTARACTGSMHACRCLSPAAASMRPYMSMHMC